MTLNSLRSIVLHVAYGKSDIKRATYGKSDIKRAAWGYYKSIDVAPEIIDVLSDI